MSLSCACASRLNSSTTCSADNGLAHTVKEAALYGGITGGVLTHVAAAKAFYLASKQAAYGNVTPHRDMSSALVDEVETSVDVKDCRTYIFEDTLCKAQCSKLC